jgi:1-deoxy-D-xylulose-5-phosphate reductoisomerase
MKPSLILLGSTGSIGTQALDVARKHGFPVRALTAAKNSRLMEEQIREFRPAVAALSDETAAADLRARVADLPVKILSGEEGILEAAALESDIALNAIVGIAGLRPTMTAIETGHTIALANKETLVTGGALVTKAAKEKGIKILPVDSEHSAVFQCLQAQPANRALRKIILTASGGPFFGKTSADLAQITPAQALKHPNWSMGAKITIDSATMMNKGFEVIEACYLFGVPEDRVSVVVHRESIIHSMVEYIDHSILAQLAVPDMRLCIQHALTHPHRTPSQLAPLDLTQIGKLTFYAPDTETFPMTELARAALRQGGAVPAVLNAANEVAVDAFLHDRIYFGEIARMVMGTLDALPDAKRATSMEEILYYDACARAVAQEQEKKGL